MKRPVASEAAPNVYLNLDGADVVRLRREDTGIHVVGVDSSSGIHPDDYDPEFGDQVVGISGNMWDPAATTKIRKGSTLYSPILQPKSMRLRIWDAITAYEESNPGSRNDDFIEFEREGSRHNCTMGKINASGRGGIVAKRITDSDGRCRFKNLPAGTYFVQAQKENRRTHFGVIHPARSGGKLYMASGCAVYVKVRYSSISILEEGGISGVAVSLKSSEPSQGGGLYTGRTDKVGMMHFDSIPWGRYQLTATPPHDLYLGSKTIDVTIEEPQQSVTVLFGSNSYTISGTVLERETRKPVPGFELGLRHVKSPRGVSTISKSDGSFEFAVYKTGEYEISPNIPRGSYKGYMPAAWELALGHHNSATLNVTVENENVEGLEYFVVPG